MWIGSSASSRHIGGQEWSVGAPPGGCKALTGGDVTRGGCGYTRVRQSGATRRPSAPPSNECAVKEAYTGLPVWPWAPILGLLPCGDFPLKNH